MPPLSLYQPSADFLQTSPNDGHPFSQSLSSHVFIISFIRSHDLSFLFLPDHMRCQIPGLLVRRKPSQPGGWVGTSPALEKRGTRRRAG